MATERGNLRLGVFGIGALGRHHTRILSTFPGVTLEGIFDTRPEVASAVAAEYGANVAASFDELRRLSSPPVHRAGRRADPSQVREMGADA